MAEWIEHWPLSRLIPYARNPRTQSDAQVAQIAASIAEFGFLNPILVDTNAGVIAGHGRLQAARKLQLEQVPVIVLDHLTETQKRAFILADNRLSENAGWDDEALSIELQSLSEADFDLDLTGFSPGEIDALLAIPDEERANALPPVPENPISRMGDIWLCGKHRVLCGDATKSEDVARLLGGRQPLLMVTDPPYGIELDSEWRDRAGLNTAPGEKRTPLSKTLAKANPQYPAEPSYLKHRTAGHTETSISGDTRADWSEAFELVPSLQIAYVWHASRFTREVLDGLLRIGFVHHQQIIWDKQRTVLTRTLYWFQHEPCWFVRKKNAPWYGKAGENSTIWASPSPKFIMGQMVLIDKKGERVVCFCCYSLGPYTDAARDAFVCDSCVERAESHVRDLAETIPELRDHRLKRWRKGCDC
jgi:hypothetical protein